MRFLPVAISFLLAAILNQPFVGVCFALAGSLFPYLDDLNVHLLKITLKLRLSQNDKFLKRTCLAFFMFFLFFRSTVSLYIGFVLLVLILPRYKGIYRSLWMLLFFYFFWMLLGISSENVVLFSLGYAMHLLIGITKSSGLKPYYRLSPIRYQLKVDNVNLWDVVCSLISIIGAVYIYFA